MNLTPSIRRAIRSGVQALYGRQRIEVGLRVTPEGLDTANALLWAPEADLQDTQNLTFVTELDDDPRLPGCALLDLYVYSPRELLGNAYVTIKDGQVVDLHDKDLEHEPRAVALLGRGYGDNRQEA